MVVNVDSDGWFFLNKIQSSGSQRMHIYALVSDVSPPYQVSYPDSLFL